MNRLSILLVVVFLIAGMIGCGTEELIPDDNLEAAIRQAIGKPYGDIYASDLSELTELHAGYRDISDITGLEHCTSLELLFLSHNQISDISPVANLTSLILLTLFHNQIYDISPVASLTSLVLLDLGSNQISDISPVTNLTDLTDLTINDNQISDLSPTVNLTRLISLNLCGNQISDILPLVENEGLSTGDVLHLEENPLSDDSINIYIPQLQARGVTVHYQGLCD